MSETNGDAFRDIDLGDLEPVEVKVKYRGKTYSLREASANAARLYRNATLRCARMSDGKISGMEGLADAEYLLVSLCLFDGDRPVPLGIIYGWPNRAVRPLYDWLREHSGLAEESKPADATEGTPTEGTADPTRPTAQQPEPTAPTSA